MTLEFEKALEKNERKIKALEKFAKNRKREFEGYKQMVFSEFGRLEEKIKSRLYDFDNKETEDSEVIIEQEIKKCRERLKKWQ